MWTSVYPTDYVQQRERERDSREAYKQVKGLNFEKMLNFLWKVEEYKSNKSDKLEEG